MNPNGQPQPPQFSTPPVRVNGQENVVVVEKDSQPSFPRWLIAAVVVPLLGACIGGVFVLTAQQNNKSPGGASTTAQSLPQLHTQYTGRGTDRGTGQIFLVAMTQVSENTQTGSFTAAYLIDYTCGGNIDGSVRTDGTVTFTYTPSPSAPAACQVGQISNTGNIQTGGVIAGNWSDAATGTSGTFTLN